MLLVAARVFALALLMLPVPGAAHLLPKQNATLHIVADKAYLVVSVPISALPGVDEDHDGKLGPEQLTRHQAAISRQFIARFHLRSPDGDAPIAFAWVAEPEDFAAAPQDGPATSYVVILAGAQFRRAPASVTVATDLFGTGSDDRQITIKVHRDSDVAHSEVGVLTAQSPEQSFFRGGWSIFADFVRLGVEHILLGYDHLLFLLTVIVAGAGWRYWLSVTSAFTVAHSITLTLAVLGVVRVSPALVEPAIALSITVVAALNLFGGRSGLGSRVAIVFACGLLHGLGFASALGSMGLVAGNRLATLAGFNIGVEIGQGLFLLAALGIGAGMAMLTRRSVGQVGARLASATALALGLVMFVGRVLPLGL